MSLVNHFHNKTNYSKPSKKGNVVDFYVTNSVKPKKRDGWKSKSLSKSSVVLDSNKVREFVIRFPPLTKEVDISSVKKGISEIVTSITSIRGLTVDITKDPGKTITPHIEGFTSSASHNGVGLVRFVKFLDNLVSKVFSNIY
jgi:hypothetical protein